MSTLSVPVVTFKLEKHPNADSLSLATIDSSNWVCVVKTADFENETVGVYIPIDSVADKDHPLLSFLEGKKVKTIRLRGYISQGVLLPLSKVREKFQVTAINIGDDVSEVLNIRKWEPPVNRSLGSCKEVRHVDGFDMYTEIENWKRYPNVITEGEVVEITEKIHGTSSRYGYVNDIYCIGSHRRILEPQPDKPTVWHIISEKYDLQNKILQLKNELKVSRLVVYGEIFGPRVQDLAYGQSDIAFRVFDIKLDEYVPPSQKNELASKLGLETVPILYTGEFTKDLLDLRFGKDFSNNHVREGFVIEPLTQRFDPSLGRVKLKVVSEDYLTRKDGTDYA
jgi:RNA ligase (TIGR02306 family)